MSIMTAPTRTLDEVERELRREQEALGRHQARTLELIREADRMQAATIDGSRTMGEWVASRLDLAPDNARTLVTTSRGAADLPELTHQLSTGVVSFDRMVELVRAQRMGVELADHWRWDVSGLRSVISLRRRHIPTRDGDASAERYLVIQPSLDEGR